MAATAPAFKSTFKAEWKKSKKEQHRQHPMPFIRKGKAILRFPRRFWLMAHWSELCHMPSLAARESRKVSLLPGAKTLSSQKKIRMLKERER